MRNNCQDLVVVITGASSGIGRASAVALARRGARLVLAARNKQALNDTLSACKRAGGEGIVLRHARSRGRRVLRLRFHEPHDLSPVVADFYRDRYARRGLRANRLLIECFVMHNPYWALCTGSVPYWITFNMEPSLEAAEAYLGASEPYDEINLLLFNHAVEAVGFPQIAEWNSGC